MKPRITRRYYPGEGWVWCCEGEGLTTWGSTPASAMRPWFAWRDSAAAEARAVILRLYESQ